MSKKLKFVLSPAHVIELDTKRFQALNWARLGSGAYRLLGLIALAALAWLLLVVIYSLFTKEDVSSVVIYQLTFATSIGAMAFVLQVAMVGWRRIVDPPVFIGVLLFALLSVLVAIIAPVMVDSSLELADFRRINTFGEYSNKAIAGLAVIGWVALYYLSNVFLDSKRKLEYATWFVVGLLILAALMNIIFPDSTDTVTASLLAAMACLVLWQVLAEFGMMKLQFAALGVIAFLSVFINGFTTNWLVQFALLATLLVWLWLWLVLRGFEMKIDLAGWRSDMVRFLGKARQMLPISKVASEKSQKAEQQESRKENMMQKHYLLHTLLLMLVVVVAMVIWIAINQPDVGQYLQQLGQAVSIRTTQLSGWQSWLVGSPGRTLIYTDGVDNFYTTVFSYQGLVGLVGYIVLIATMMIASVRQLRKASSDGGNEKVSLPVRIFTPVLVLVPIFGLFANISVPVMLLWWVLFSLVTAAEYLPRRRELSLMSKVVVRKRDFTKLYWALVVVLTVVVWLTWTAVNSNLTKLFDAGTI